MWTRVCALSSTRDVFFERLGDASSAVSALRDDVEDISYRESMCCDSGQ